MRTRYTSLAILLVALAIGLAACSGGGAPKVDWNLDISGAVTKPLTLSYADLARREQVTIENVLMRRSQGEDTTNTWEGPSLAAILEEAGASASARATTCTAADGYAIEIPIADLQDAIVALKQDGAWSADDEKSGPIRIVVPDLPANSWIYQLVKIEVVE